MWKDIAILVALAACVWFLLKLGRNRNGESRSARLMEKYKTLTPDLLAETPDEELVEAVVACVLAEAADSRRPDPAYTLSKRPQPYTVVYSIWAVCKEMANGTYAALMRLRRSACGGRSCYRRGAEIFGCPAQRGCRYHRGREGIPHRCGERVPADSVRDLHP